MKARKGIFVTAFMLLLFNLPVVAATITIVPQHGNDGTGFYDATARAPAGGNPKTTVGEQRLFAARYVASLLGSRLQSNVEIRVSATFKALNCTQNSGMLGHAGPNNTVANFANAPKADVYYPIALANALAGQDMDPASADIGAEFNSTIDSGTPSCLQGSIWYYGLDGNPPSGSFDFITTFAHELLHGLGFISFTDEQTGALVAAGKPDIFTTYIRDLDQSKTWPAMTDAQRAASAINTGRLVWSGASVTSQGVPSLTAGTAGAMVMLYAPNPLEPGSSVSHWDQSLVPNALMEPYDNADVTLNNGLGLATCLLQDIGWKLTAATQCPDEHVATAPRLVATPSPLDFGAVLVGGTKMRTLTLSNIGDKPLLTAGWTAPADYSVINDGCTGKALYTGMQCTLDVLFAPTTVGTANDTLSINSNGATASVVLTAIVQLVATPLIQVSSNRLSFADVGLRHGANKTLSITNVGTGNLTLANVTGLTSPFSVPANACSGKTLTPNASCNLTVRFSPTVLGAASDALTIHSNDKNVVVNVDGSGVPAPMAPLGSDRGGALSLWYLLALLVLGLGRICKRQECRR